MGLREIARLESQVADVQNHIGQLETIEELAERRYANEELFSHGRRNSIQDLHSLEQARTRACSLEARFSELHAWHGADKRRESELLEAEAAECAKLEAEVCAAGFELPSETPTSGPEALDSRTAAEV